MFRHQILVVTRTLGHKIAVIGESPAKLVCGDASKRAFFISADLDTREVRKIFSKR